MRNLALAILLFCGLSVTAASAQGSGQLQAGQVWGNPTAAAKPATGTTIGALLDQSYACTGRGSIMMRGTSLWGCFAPTSTSGLPLVSGGTGADLIWARLTLGALAAGTQDTVIGYWTGTAASAIAVNNCTGGLTYSTSSHVFGCSAYASLAEYLAGTATRIIQPSTIYTAEVTTTYGTTTTFDFTLFINTVVTLTGNITTQTLSNVTAGKAGTITFIQDGTGSRTTVWNSIFKFAGGVTPTLTTTASAIDVLSYSCRSATFCVAALLKDVR